MSLTESQQILVKRLPFTRETIQEGKKRLKNIVLLKTAWYPEIVDALENSARAYFEQQEFSSSKMTVLPVPGTLEFPLAFSEVTQQYSSEDSLLVLLGCIIQGETPHFDIICHSSFQKILDIQTSTRFSSGVGILTVKDVDQARARKDKGSEASQAAWEMFLLKCALQDKKDKEI